MINSKTLTNWYSIYKRHLPWRETKNPYYIWLSEIILQQTRVAQGMPYYLKFIEKFPTIQHLAKAEEQEVLKLWQGLGYYSRARNLHTAAQYVTCELDGIFPDTYHEILKLKGVGDYTASAIASICFNAPTPVLDGNVFRVIARYYGIETPIHTGKAQSEFKQILHEIIDPENPADFNQAIMEFGAIQCKPKSPNCTSCPFQTQCYAYRTNKVDQFPVKLKPKKEKKRYFNYLVFLSADGKTILEKRTQKDIWKNLYQFPLIESEREQKKDSISKEIKEKYDVYTSLFDLQLYNDKEKVHKLSHQHIYTKFWIVYVDELKRGISLKQLKQYPFPVLISNFLNTFNY